MEQDLEIEPSEGRLQNNAAYIQSWKEEIRENPNALFTAITDADKIAKYVSERTQEYRHTKDVQFTRLSRKRTLIRSRYINAVSATKKAE